LSDIFDFDGVLEYLGSSREISFSLDTSTLSTKGWSIFSSVLSKNIIQFNKFMNYDE